MKNVHQKPEAVTEATQRQLQLALMERDQAQAESLIANQVLSAMKA